MHASSWVHTPRTCTCIHLQQCKYSHSSVHIAVCILSAMCTLLMHTLAHSQLHKYSNLSISNAHSTVYSVFHTHTHTQYSTHNIPEVVANPENWKHQGTAIQSFTVEKIQGKWKKLKKIMKFANHNHEIEHEMRQMGIHLFKVIFSCLFLFSRLCKHPFRFFWSFLVTSSEPVIGCLLFKKSSYKCKITAEV